MKKNIKYILLMLLLLLPTGVLGDSISTDTHSCTTSDSSRKYTIPVGGSVTITCNESLNQSGACDHSAFSDLNDTGVCRNDSNFSLPYENNNVARLTVSTVMTERGIFSNTYQYTLTAQNSGRNQFWCDSGNYCYEITVTEADGSMPNAPTASNDLFSTIAKSGYGCYYLSGSNNSDGNIVFYTNRDMSGTGATDLFAGSNNIQNIYNSRRSYYIGITNGYDMDTFSNYSSGQAMSADTCAAAGAVLMRSSGSGIGGGLAGDVRFVEELNSGEAGVYDVFGNASDYNSSSNILIMYGNGFRVYDADYSESDPYDCDGCSHRDSSIFASTAAALDSNWRDTYSVSACYDSINSQESMNQCFGCVNRGSINQACSNTSIYSIGILPEPDSVTDVINNIENADPNEVVDGHAIGGGGSETSQFTWTCEDVKYTTFAFTTLRILAPFLLLIFGSLDFLKAVYAADVKKQQEAKSKFPRRLIAFLLLIILPFVVGFIFKNLGTHRSNVMTAFCCVATNGNSECTRYNDVSDTSNTGNSNSSATNNQ